MAVDEGLYAWVQEALEPIGAVTMRKMMGAATLYLDGVIFAVLDESELWFKADAETIRSGMPKVASVSPSPAATAGRKR